MAFFFRQERIKMTRAIRDRGLDAEHQGCETMRLNYPRVVCYTKVDL
jgi:hypothetical protein